MKERLTAFVTLGCIFSLFFYYKIYSSNNENIAEDDFQKSSQKVVQELTNKINEKNPNEEVSDTPINEPSHIKECSLGQADTDQMSFSESFKYYRECNGKGSLFIWNSSEFSTLLADEVDKKDTKLVDSKNIPIKHNVADKHHLALQKEFIGANLNK